MDAANQKQPKDVAALKLPQVAPWVLGYDANGRLYYFNTATEESVWEPPEGCQ